MFNIYKTFKNQLFETKLFKALILVSFNLVLIGFETGKLLLKLLFLTVTEPLCNSSFENKITMRSEMRFDGDLRIIDCNAISLTSMEEA